ncbi:hypothetical protein EWM64_g7922, partial [Hericium alpestre]
MIGSTMQARYRVKSAKQKRPLKPSSPFIGRLPTDLHLLILQNLPVPDIPAYARASRALARLAASDPVWDRRWTALDAEKYAFGLVLDDLAARASKAATDVPPTLDVADDDFG